MKKLEVCVVATGNMWHIEDAKDAFLNFLVKRHNGSRKYGTPPSGDLERKMQKMLDDMEAQHSSESSWWREG